MNLRRLNKFVSTRLGFRDKRNEAIRSRLSMKSFSIFSNNCLGGVFLHDAGLRFNSPLVNLAMDGESFLAFLSDPQRYLDGDFKFLNNTGKSFPVGQNKEITISFVHYKNEEEAIEKWRTRSERIIWDDIYVIATGHNGLECSECMECFDRMPYKNKIMFTYHNWPQYEWAKHVRFVEHMKEMPPLTEFATMNGKRIYDMAFDIASWIYECEVSKK